MALPAPVNLECRSRWQGLPEPLRCLVRCETVKPYQSVRALNKNSNPDTTGIRRLLLEDSNLRE